MKRILITGKNSYVGKSLEKWLENNPDHYFIDSISLRDESWKEMDFSKYDVVFHVAGIAHIRETKENSHLYYSINRDLAYEVAKKAKINGIKQFIFLSSMSVYGMESGTINADTPLNPKNNYGKSKLQAEKLIASIEEENFKIVTLRPPMIYGKGCKGNYTKLANIAVKTPIFPNICNKRSMIYIDNLCELIRILIDNSSNGIYLPQNKEQVCTSELVKMIAEMHGKKVKLTTVFNPLISFVQTNLIKKVFGDLVYEVYEPKMNYHVYDFKSSISLTERGH